MVFINSPVTNANGSFITSFSYKLIQMQLKVSSVCEIHKAAMYHYLPFTDGEIKVKNARQSMSAKQQNMTFQNSDFSHLIFFCV